MTAAWMPPAFADGLGSTEAWNALVAACGQPIPLGETGTVLHFALADGPGPEAFVTELALHPIATPIFLHVVDFPFRALFNADLSMSDLGGLPEGLRQALSEGVLETLRATLPADLAGRFEGKGSGLASGYPVLSSAGMQWFSLRLAGANGFTADLMLACDRALAVRALPDLSGASSAAGEALAQHITVPVDMTLGSITLLHEELAILEPGAVVVLAETEPGALMARSGETLYQFTQTDQGWRSSGPQPAARFHPRTTVHSRHPMDDDSAETAVEKPVLTDELRVAIDFDLGRSMVPLSVVTKWQPGALIDLTPPQLAEGVAVTIRANGDAVGTGDIVRVDDRLAVRITRFSLRS